MTFRISRAHTFIEKIIAVSRAPGLAFQEIAARVRRSTAFVRRIVDIKGPNSLRRKQTLTVIDANMRT